MEEPKKDKTGEKIFIGAVIVVGLMFWWVITISTNREELKEANAQLMSELSTANTEYEDLVSEVEEQNTRIDDQNGYLDGLNEWFDNGWDLREYAEQTPRLEPISL